MNLPTVLHVEVGGSYGGSLRALELYLQYADPGVLRHDLLLYHPTPGIERLRPLVHTLNVLDSRALAEGKARRPSWLPRGGTLEGCERAAALAGARRRVHQLSRAILASGCQAVHCNNSFPYQAATLAAARRARVPIAAHVRNPLSGHWHDRRLARSLAMLIGLHSEHLRQMRPWGLAAEMVQCPDGIELPAADAVRAAALRHQSLPQKGKLIAAIGRLVPQKGFDLLIAAASRLVPRHPEARFMIVGEGPERAKLEAAIGEHRLDGRVILAGFDPDVASILAASDLVVCSSRWEGLPLSVLEAILAGIPVVATQSALAGEPRLFPLLAAQPAAPNAEALASAIEAALSHPANEARIEAARGWVQAEFSPAATALRLDDALSRVVNQRLRSRSYYETAYTQSGWKRPTEQAPQFGARFTKMWYQAFQQHVLPRVEWRGRRVLEVGAGYGYLAPLIAARGGGYVGLDMAESALRQLPRGAQGGAAVLGDACRLPFADASFGAVICMEVFEHIRESDALLQELFRVAAPGADVILSCPNYCNLFLPIKLLADWGVAACRRYITRQPVDRTLFAFRLRRALAQHAEVVEQRAVRLHPPLFERLEYRFGPTHWAGRMNNWIFSLERRRGERLPWRNLGLHTCFHLRTAAGAAKEC